MSGDALHRAKPVFFIERSLRMKWMRQAHVYRGFFIAPGPLLFAVTGALRPFGMGLTRKNDRMTGWGVLSAGAGLPVLVLALLAGA